MNILNYLKIKKEIFLYFLLKNDLFSNFLKIKFIIIKFYIVIFNKIY
jgi:hypothetical protein